MRAVPSLITQPGPWRHRDVAGNGQQFHVTEVGSYRSDRPLVVFLHSIPQYWWAWRHQLAALEAAGWSALAMDLRGFGGSDKPRGRHGMAVHADDVAGVIRSSGVERAVVVGHGLGGAVAWSMPASYPDLIAGLVTVACPHPARMPRRAVTSELARWLSWAQPPWFPERAITRDDIVSQMLDSWSAPGNPEPRGQAETYTAVARQPRSPNLALENLRWVVRNAFRGDGRRHRATMRRQVPVPTLSLRGSLDPLFSRSSFERDRLAVAGPFRRGVVTGAGHFLPEEAPDSVSGQLLGYLTEFHGT